jgi:hypothetical protein
VNSPADIPERMTQKEFAAHLGCSEPMVTKHKNAGRLVMEGRMVLVRESLARIESWKDPARGGDRTGKELAQAPLAAAIGQAVNQPPVSGAQGAASGDAERLNYNMQAAREKLAAAQLRELELAREAGALVLKQERDDAEFGRARAGREAVLSIPDRCAVLCAAKSDAAEVYAILMAECRRVCQLLAGQPDADAPAVSSDGVKAVA